MVNTPLTLDERLELAMEARRQGANCSRSVLMAFPDLPGMPPQEIAAAMADGFGGGVGGCGMLCGAISGMVMADGLARPKDLTKAQIYKRTAEMTDTFVSENGSPTCHVLKHELHRDCNALIRSAVTILHNKL